MHDDQMDLYANQDIGKSSGTIKNLVLFVIFSAVAGLVISVVMSIVQIARDELVQDLHNKLVEAQKNLKEERLQFANDLLTQAHTHDAETKRRKDAQDATRQLFLEVAEKDKRETFKVRETIDWLWRFSFEDASTKKTNDYATGYPDFPVFKRKDGTFSLLDKDGKVFKEGLLAVAPFSDICLHRFAESSPIGFMEKTDAKRDWYGLVLIEGEGRTTLDWIPLIHQGEVPKKQKLQ